jgi:uncharacterized protein (UPF0333 family)
VPIAAKKEKDLFGKIDKKLLLIPAVILVSGLVVSLYLRSRQKASNAASSVTSTVQEAAQSAVHATSEAVQPVVETARRVFRFGEY